MILRILLSLLLAGLAAPLAAQTCPAGNPRVAPDSRYLATEPDPAGHPGEFVVRDLETGLEWKRCSEGQFDATCIGTAGTMGWSAALAAARSATWGGYDDWRLPNVAELESLVERGCHDPAINGTVFPGTPAQAYWSATTDTVVGSSAWSVEFGGSGTSPQAKYFSLQVRLVRGALGFGPLTLSYLAGTHGSLAGDPDQLVVQDGSGSPVTAVPDTGYHFVDWSDGATDNPRTDTNVQGDITVTANFAINEYTLTYGAGPHGSVSGTSPQTVAHGADGTPVTALPDAGYHFLRWSDGSTANPRTDTAVTASLAVEAEFEGDAHALSFDSHGGEAVAPIAARTGDLVPLPPAPLRNGYTFVEWNSAADGSGSHWPAGMWFVMPGSDFTLHAIWVVTTYSLEFDSHGGSAVAPINAVAGESVTLPAAPLRTGYAFVAWNSAADGSGTAYAAGSSFTMPQGHVMLHAIWSAIAYTLDFDSQGGSAVAPISAHYGDILTLPAAPLRSGYALVHWNTAADGTGSAYAPGASFTMPAANLTLHAIWLAGGYTLSFDPHGGSFVAPIAALPGQRLNLPGAPLRPGYTFANWNRAADGSSTAYGAGGVYYMPASDTTLHAIWMANTYTLSFDSQGGSSVAPITAKTGQVVTLPAAPNRAGFAFMHWNLAADGSGAAHAAGTSFTMLPGDTTLFAIWALGDHTVLASSGGNGTILPAFQGVVDGGSATFTVTPDSGYRADSVTGDTCTPLDQGGGTWVAAGITAHCEVLASFVPLSPPRIGVSPASLAAGLIAGTSGSATLAIANTGGHPLDWSIALPAPSADVDASALVLRDQTRTPSGGYVRAYYDLYGPALWATQAADDFQVPGGATWTVEQVYVRGTRGTPGEPTTVVQFHLYADSGSGTPGTLLYYESSAAFAESGEHLVVTLATPQDLGPGTYWVSVVPERHRYLDGDWKWAVSSSRQGSEYHWRNPGGGYNASCTNWGPASSCGGTIGTDLVFALYGETTGAACAIPAPTPWLSLDHSAGSVGGGGAESVLVGFDATSLAVGSYTANLCVSSNDPVQPLVTVPVTLAVDPAPFHTVTFVDWDGTVLKTESVAHGGAATAPADPSRTGYTFTGWDVAFDHVTADLTVTAQYAINQYTVTFLDWDGATLKTEQVDYGSAATAPADPSRTGYTFTGWDVAFDHVTADLTVTAQYAINQYTVTFLDWDGATLKTEQVDYGSAATAPAAPSRTGYTFTGWDVPFDHVTADLTVTAQYAINQYTVTFLDWDGATLKTEQVDYGSAATAPADPSRTGYTFTGWDVPFDHVTADLTVTAQYAIDSYTLSYAAGAHGSLIGATVQTVAYGQDGTPVAAVADAGYAFAGWSDGEDANPRIDRAVTGDLTVSAVFAAGPVVIAETPATVGVVTLEPRPDAAAKQTLLRWSLHGSAGENVVLRFAIRSDNPTREAADLTLEYEAPESPGTWLPLPLGFTADGWSGELGAGAGFPLLDGEELDLRATFHRGGRYSTTARLVGALSGTLHAPSGPAVTEVAQALLGGLANAAGRVGEPVEAAMTLVNAGTAALSSGLPSPGNPIPAQPAPNDENMRGRFLIAWDGGALVPAGMPSCGDASCASPDVDVEFYDESLGGYRHIFNLRAELDAGGNPTGRLYGHFGSLAAGGVPLPVGHAGTYLLRTTAKRHLGTYTLTPQVVGVTSGTIYAESAAQVIGIGAGSATAIAIVAGDGGEAVAGGAGYDQGDLVVEVSDAAGNPVPGVAVAFNVLPGAAGAGASLSTPALTDGAGRTRVTASPDSRAGTLQVAATLANGVGLAVPFGLENLPDSDPAQVRIAIAAGDGQTAQVGTDYALPLRARVTDRFGNALAGVAVDFAAPAAGAGLVPGLVPATSGPDGLAGTGTVGANATAGAFVATATVGAAWCDATPPNTATCAVDYHLANTAAGAASVTLASSAASAMVGSAAAYALTARVVDVGGNPVPGVSVTLVGPGSGAGIAPGIVAGISDAAGEVRRDFDANSAAGDFVVQAVVSGTSGASVVLRNLPGAAASIEVVSGDHQARPVTTAFDDLVVRVVDAYGNAVADDAAVAVGFTAPASGASAAVAATASSGIGGLATTSATANAVAGSYTVVAGLGATNLAFALENTAGSIAVTGIRWAANGATTLAYTGADQAILFDTDPATASGDCSASYNAGTALPRAAGTYVVQVACSNAYGAGTGSATLAITPAEAGNSGIVLAGGSFGYDGQPHAASVANPQGVAYTLAYAPGGAVPPVDAGSYGVTLTVTDPNHAAETLVTQVEIVPAAVALTFGNLNQVYDGTVKSASVTANPDVGGVGLAYRQGGAAATPLDAGSYDVVASLANPNYALAGPTTAVLSIAKAGGTVAWDGATQPVFDGSAHALAATLAEDATAPCVLSVISGEHPRVEAGATALAASCEGRNHVATGSVMLAVMPKPVAIVLAGLGSFPYDGDDHPAAATVAGEVAGFPASPVLTYNGGGAAPNAVGSYEVVAVVAGGNYAAAPATGLIVIDAATATVTLSDLIHVYDGTAQAATVSTDPPGLAVDVTYDGVPTAPTDAGSYSVVASVAEPGYTGSAAGTLVIAKAAAAVVITDTTQVWDGAPKPVAVATDPAGLAVTVTYDGSSTAPAAIGEYAVLAVIDEANYEGQATATLRIVAQPVVDLAVTIDDHRDYVQFGKLLTHVATVRNAGNEPVFAATVEAPIPDTLLSLGWQCQALGGASCTPASGTGDVLATVDVPLGGLVMFTLDGVVNDDVALPTDVVEQSIAATAVNDDSPSNDTASDTTQAVLFRDGFERYGDGSGNPAAAPEAGKAQLGETDSVTLLLGSPATAGVGLRTIAWLAAASGERLRVELLQAGGEHSVRLAGEVAGEPVRSAWSRVAPTAAQLAVALVAGPSGTQLVLVGAEEDLVLPLGAEVARMELRGAVGQ